MMMTMTMEKVNVKLNVSVKCNTKPFAEPQFEVNQEKGISLPCPTLHCTAMRCNEIYCNVMHCCTVYNLHCTVPCTALHSYRICIALCRNCLQLIAQYKLTLIFLPLYLSGPQLLAGCPNLVCVLAWLVC